MSESARSGPDPLPATVVPEAHARELLTEGEIEVLGRIPWASNATLLAEVSRGGLNGLGIYKPARGERPLWDFPTGTLYRREVAAYLVSEALGWGLVPLTVVREGPFGVGSVQLYVEADPDVTAFDLLAAEHPSLPRIAAFDVVVNNADRKAGHCLHALDGRVWAIDHGVCFHTEPKLRTVLWDLAGQPLGSDAVADLERLSATIRGEPDGRLGALLEPGELEAVARRAARLSRTAALPSPGPGRPYPWPLV